MAGFAETKAPRPAPMPPATNAYLIYVEVQLPASHNVAYPSPIAAPIAAPISACFLLQQ